MSKFVVVVVSDEKKAYEALRSIQDLHSEGMVTLFGAGVVERKADGGFEVKQEADEGVLGTAAAALIGTLVGAVGGPVGAAIGFGTGSALGASDYLLHAGVTDEFVQTITREMTPGKFAVVAEMSEDWVAPLDAKMEALGGKVMREYRDEFIDHMLENRAAAVRNDLDQRKTEHAGAKAEKMEKKLEEQIDDARKDLQKTASQAHERLEQKKDEMNAKLEALQQQAAKAKPEVKGRIEKRIAEVRKELRNREQKLNHAYELAEQALNP